MAKKSTQKIQKIFLQLIQKYNIEQISVTTICKEAKINRSTFYANYIDIYDLAEKIKNQMEEEFGEFQINNHAQQNPDGYLSLFTYVKNNQIFFKTYFKLEAISMSKPTQYNAELAKKYYDNKFIDYHIEFFRAGLNAIIKKWLESGCKETPEQMTDIITSEYKK